MEFAFVNDPNGFLGFIAKRLRSEKEARRRRDFEAIPFNGLEIIDTLLSAENKLDELVRLCYQLEKERPALKFSVDHLLTNVLYRSFDGGKPYIISSCQALLAGPNYEDNHDELWWRLSKIQINDTTMYIYSKAIQLAESNGLLDKISSILWTILTPHKWSGSLRKFQQNF